MTASVNSCTEIHMSSETLSKLCAISVGLKQTSLRRKFAYVKYDG